MFSCQYRSALIPLANARGSETPVPAVLIALVVAAALTANGSSLSPTFQTTGYATGQATAGVVAVGDYNNDGATDVVATAGTRVVTMKGQLASGLPDGSLSLFQTTAFNPATSCAATTFQTVAAGWHHYLSTSSPVFYGTLGLAGYVYHIDSSSKLQGATASCDTSSIGGSPGLSMSSIATGDFDGDGLDDSAGARGNANIYVAKASVFGTGNPTFTAIALPNALTQATSVTTGDFNSEGRPDIAATAGTSIAFFPAQNKPQNTPVTQIFTTATASSVSIGGASNVRRVLIADATGDAKADLIATTDTSVVVIPGNGAGAFSSPITLAMPANYAAASIAAGDFNSDGFPDLAVTATASGGASSAVIHLFLGAGASNFSAAQSVALGGNPVANISPADIAAADMNRDGRMDLAVAGSGDGNVWVLLNTTKTLVISTARGLQLNAVTGKPFSGQATITIGTSDSGPVPALTAAAAATSTPHNWVAIGVSGSQITLTPAIASAPGTGVYRGVVAVSGSGYGRTLIPYSITIVRPSAQLLRGGSTGTAATGLSYQPGAGSGPLTHQMAIGDFSGDGIPDIASSTGNLLCNGGPQYCAGIYVRKTDGTGYNFPTMAKTVSNYNSAVGAAAAADFNRDGKLDAFFAATNGMITIAFSDGAGAFTSSRFHPVPAATGQQSRI